MGTALSAAQRKAASHSVSINSMSEKFYFSFEREAADKLADFQISVHSYNVFGTEEIVEYTDQNPNLIHTSTINLHKEADEITILVPEGLDGLKITNAGIKNEFQFSKERFFFFLALYALIAFLFFSRSAWAKKVESRFLVFTLVIGTVFVSVLPISKVGWDEEIHFNRAYTLPITRTAKLTPTLHEYTAVSLTNWPYNLPQSKEEKVELFGSLDTLADYRSPEAIEISNKPNLANFYNLHYIPQALGIKAGQLLHLNFGYVYMLGRWCNLLAYAVIMYFAIKKTADRETTDGSDRFNAYADLSCKHLFLRCHDHRRNHVWFCIPARRIAGSEETARDKEFRLLCCVDRSGISCQSDLHSACTDGTFDSQR